MTLNTRHLDIIYFYLRKRFRKLFKKYLIFIWIVLYIQCIFVKQSQSHKKNNTWKSTEQKVKKNCLTSLV